MDGTAVLAAIWSPLITCPRNQGQGQAPCSKLWSGEGRNVCVGLHRGPLRLRNPVYMLGGVMRVGAERWGSL